MSQTFTMQVHRPEHFQKGMQSRLLTENMIHLYHVILGTLKLRFSDLHPLYSFWFAIIRRQSGFWFRGKKYNRSDAWSGS